MTNQNLIKIKMFVIEFVIFVIEEGSNNYDLIINAKKKNQRKCKKV